MNENNILPQSVQTKRPPKVFGITDTTMKRLLTQPNPANPIALYAFLIYTTQRQGTQKVYATESFIARGLRWSRSKVGMVKRQLRDMGLVESFARRDEKGKVAKHYLLVRFAANCPDAKNPDAKSPTGGKIGGKMLCDRSSNAADVNGNAANVRQRHANFSNSRFVPSRFPSSVQQVYEVGSKLEMDVDSCNRFIRYSNGNRWKIKSRPINNWPEVMRGWWESCNSSPNGAADVPHGWIPAIIPPDDEPAAAPAAARPVAPAIAPPVKPAAVAEPAVCALGAASAAPRLAYGDPQAVEGDEIPAELETTTAL